MDAKERLLSAVTILESDIIYSSRTHVRDISQYKTTWVLYG
jgi:hypothetical protein